MRVLLGAGLTAGLLSGCKKEPAATGTPPTTAAQPATPPATPPGGAPMAARPPMPAPPAVAAATAGAVLETMNSGGYTYAKLDLGSEQVWVAGPETKLAVGDKIDMVGGTLMTNFTSNTLNRTFDRIYFVNALPPAGTGGAPAGDPAAAHGGAMPPAAPAAPTEKIEPVAGGQTIAALLAAPAPLAGKPVAIRGKVVKFNAQILGHNWLHLQDGTGDLTITTADTAAPVAVGEIVVARGTLAVNKDFGAGYSYPVIVEDATLAAK